MCDDGTYIKLDGKGILIMTEKKICFQALKDIELKAAKKIELTGEEGIHMECRETSIDIEPEMISIYGTDIMLNDSGESRKGRRRNHGKNRN